MAIPKVLLLIGTRPEGIKMAPILAAARARPGLIEPIVAVTGQHHELLEPVLATFGVRPDFDLEIMRPNQDLFDVTTRALDGLKDVLSRVRPDWVLVQGDTTTAFVGALAAYYARIKVGHVEAGLRTYDLDQPYPEEGNRHLISVLASAHFAPTQRARENLLAERVDPQTIHVTGNTVIDALLDVAARPAPPFPETMKDIDWTRKVILITMHRRESFGPPMADSMHAMAELVRTHEDVEIVYPVHLNPNVQESARSILAGVARIHLVEPLAYEVFVHVMKRSHLILTDSGGVQEEGPSLGKPVLVMRDKSERPEGIEAGTVILVGPHRDTIQAGVGRLLADTDAYRRMSRARNPYGDGHAAGRIVDVLAAGVRERPTPWDRPAGTA